MPFGLPFSVEMPRYNQEVVDAKLQDNILTLTIVATGSHSDLLDMQHITMVCTL